MPLLHVSKKGGHRGEGRERLERAKEGRSALSEIVLYTFKHQNLSISQYLHAKRTLKLKSLLE